MEITLAEELAETAHWSDEPPVRIEEDEFDLLAFELWHLGSCPDLVEVDEWEDEECTVASHASCL
ncbi:MAG TPA: hypothetical protein VGZ73_05895 [Bryobacteraceae bacterium]|jgi:hypothetical protein|nr:hypothetical protein [Bryobacteraceae bacterium]